MSIPEHILDVHAKAKCLYSREEVEASLKRMATEIHEKLADRNPILLAVMVGGLIPAGNLLPLLDFPLEVNYIHATRYQGETRGGELYWKVKPSCSLEGRTILILDDILDGGITLAAIIEYCKEQGAKDVYSAVLVDKQHVRVEGGLPKADFTGLIVDDHYIYGYGMDYKEYLRNAPGIFMVAPEHE